MQKLLVHHFLEPIKIVCAGCKLHIQVMFPAQESPTDELVHALEHLGAASVSMPRSLEALITRATKNDASMAGFMLKISAIILSTFQEVYFLRQRVALCYSHTIELIVAFLALIAHLRSCCFRRLYSWTLTMLR